uniref:Acyloxyacyl hydrolase n=1 Tax=Strigops habroptila TaxID=2489341 RepID=A0A672UYE4_STRHB
MAFTNELDWPQFSEITGFLNSTIGGWTDSLYLRLRSRNRCNHRDLQNISKNGGSSGNLLRLIKSLARNQLLDNPAIVIYATIGNDVCNGNNDTLAYMTTPKEMLSNVLQALRYLDTRLPNGSHVILTGLVDGRFLWDNLHDRYHPLGQLNRDITYSQLYSFLDCLQVRSLAVAYEPPFPSACCSSPAPCACPDEPLQGLDDPQRDPQELDLRGESQRSPLAQTLFQLVPVPEDISLISQRQDVSMLFPSKGGEKMGKHWYASFQMPLRLWEVNGLMNVFPFQPLSCPNSFLKDVISLRKK